VAAIEHATRSKPETPVSDAAEEVASNE